MVSLFEPIARKRTSLKILRRFEVLDDVIVVGAGPGGNNAAYHLATLGYRVTVVDRRQRIGEKLCTGIVGRECVQRFPLDQSLIYREARSAFFISPSGILLDLARRETQAYVIDRVSYVASFADKARQAGATYLLSHQVTSISPGASHVDLQLLGGQQAYTLQARAVVVASGFGTDLTRDLGLDSVGDFATGTQAEVTTHNCDQIHIYFGRQVAPGFFAWLVPTRDQSALVGLMARQNAHDYLKNLIARLQAEGLVTSVVKGPARWGIPLRTLSRTFSNRVVVLGDAAGQTKPTTGGGIYYALLAGEIAAQRLHGAFAKGDLSGSQLSGYEREWKALLGRDLQIGYSARRFFELLQDHQLDSIMHTISVNGLRKELLNDTTLSFDWHSETIIRALGHPVLGRFLRFLTPLAADLTSRVAAHSGSR